MQGLNLLELASHLGEKAAQLWHEGLGRIKMALVGTDTSSLLEILERSFGHVDLNTSVSSALTEKSTRKSPMTEEISEKTSEAPDKPSVTPSDDGGLASVELVFPLKSIPLIITGLPKSFLPFCDPETLSHYQCQFPACTQEFSQKAAGCNHV